MFDQRDGERGGKAHCPREHAAATLLSSRHVYVPSRFWIAATALPGSFA
jgi:hypothetical protein